MKILVIIASPRKHGNTFDVVEKMSAKWKSHKDTELEYIFLADLNLGFCKGCCACLTKGEDYCPNKSDDIKMIEEKILASDGVVFASPVYAMNMPALMKNFMDRIAFTMHRPRFFKQYTMVVAVTGSVGLKETIDSISQLKFSGFNIVQTLGLVADDALLKPKITNTKMIKKIEDETEKFYKTVSARKSIKPSFINLMQYKMGKKTFSKHKDEMPCDWAYFDSHGWFESKRNYYTEDANISFGKNILAKMIAKFI